MPVAYNLKVFFYLSFINSLCLLIQIIIIQLIILTKITHTKICFYNEVFNLKSALKDIEVLLKAVLLTPLQF